MKTNRILGPLSAMAIGLLSAFPAAATQWSWDAASAVNVDANTWKITSNGQSVLVHGYSTASTSNPLNGNFTTTNVELNRFDPGGFGIDNNNDTGEGSSPEHAVDNNQLYDVLVFELPDKNFDLQGFRLGWAQDGGTAGQADVSVFFGGNDLGANYDFKNACFVGGGCANSGTGSNAKGDLSYLKFTEQLSALRDTTNNAILGTGTSENTPIDQFVSDGGDTTKGRYVVMTGLLGGTTTLSSQISSWPAGFPCLGHLHCWGWDSSDSDCAARDSVSRRRVFDSRSKNGGS